MIHGPFPAFSSMIDDAEIRAPYVAAAMVIVSAGLVSKIMDDDCDVTGDDVMNALARQCGMIVGHEALTGWTYELTEN